MRIASTITLLGLAGLLASGCAGPERKLSRGLMNVTEPMRMGEFTRAVEQQTLWHNSDVAYTPGVIKGITRTVVRTAMGAFETVTFLIPTPTYGPMLTSKSRVWPDSSFRNRKYPFLGMTFSEYPVYPDSYTPRVMDDAIFNTDTALGFSGGDVAPFIPGSRFRIFDN